MLAAGANPHMTKYEFALLRRDLRSAICLPLFIDPKDWEKPPSARKPFGVVSIDSIHSLSHIFHDEIVMQALARASLTVCAKLLE